MADFADQTLRHKLIMGLLVAATVAAGAYLSKIGFLGHEWLSRAGCVIVILGIWSGLGGLLQERFLYGRNRWRLRNALVRTRAELHSRSASAEEMELELDKVRDSFAQQSADLAHQMKLSLGVVEFAVLVTGTFLWGFGDLIAQFLLA